MPRAGVKPDAVREKPETALIKSDAVGEEPVDQRSTEFWHAFSLCILTFIHTQILVCNVHHACRN